MQVNVEKYHEWIQLVAELTVSSLNSWQWASNSVYYLLGLWSRLVSSMPYLKGESPSLLETYVPKITEAYLTSRSVSYLSVACLTQVMERQGTRHWHEALAHAALWTCIKTMPAHGSHHAYCARLQNCAPGRAVHVTARAGRGYAKVRRRNDMQAGFCAGGAVQWADGGPA